MMLYEELLSSISKSGPCYRWGITLMISFLSMKAAFDMFLLNLSTAQVPFHCAEALLDNGSGAAPVPWSSILSNYSLASPVNITDFQCSRPRLVASPDGSLRLATGGHGSNETNPDRCESWTFLAPGRSILSEYQLVCDRQYFNDRMQTVLQLGICLATLLGPLGDAVGRKPVLLALCYLNLASSMAAVFVTDLTWQMVLRFFMGCGDPAQLMGLMLITEIVSQEYRSQHGNLFWITWTLAYMGSAGVAYLLTDWRLQLAVVVGVTGLSYAAYAPLLPESPRWLLTRRKTQRARRVLRQICQLSGCEDALSRFSFENNELVCGGGSGHSEPGLCRCIPRANICRPVYLVTLAVVTLSFFTSNLVYHALCFQRDLIASDPYVNVAIAGALELPAHVVAWPLINRLGRRGTTVGSMCLTGVALVTMPLLPSMPGATQVQSCLAVAAKFSSTVTYSVLNVYGAEVLPTKVRSCSLFLAYSIMTVGQFLAPELGGVLAARHPALPGLLYGGSTALVGLLVLLLPETRGRAMPNSVRQMRPLSHCCSGSQPDLKAADAEEDKGDNDELAARVALKDDQSARRDSQEQPV